jgi:Flp pilus assembly protein TadD
VPVVVLAVLLCLLELPGLAATLHERDATRAIDRGDAAGALRLANDAVAAEPWAASTFALRAQLLQRAGRVDAARVDLRRAIKAEPANWRHWFLLARLETSAGRSDAALAALAQARRLDPRSPIFR